MVVVEVREEIRAGFEETRSKIEEESKRTREKVDALGDEINQKMDQFQNQMKQFLKGRSMGSKASMADSLSIRTADEKKMVREFLTRLREFPKEKIAGSTLADLGRLFGAIGESDEALKLNQEALHKASTDLEKATAHYNQFVTLLEKSQYERALEEYKAAVSSRDGRAEFELFPGGKYTPLKILGAGGFGVAFLCREATGREAVVKALLELTEKDAVISEAGVLQQVDSPHIIKITDYGYADWSTRKGPYLGMRYFPGQDMEVWIQERGAFSIDRGLEIAKAVALGMKSAHQKNIFHRDLKPANILYHEMNQEKGGFDKSNPYELKIIDFGLALRGQALAEQQRSLAGKSDRSVLEQEIAGTLKYAPPEQLGEIQHSIGPWSDIYSYGMTLNEIFFGHFKPSKKQKRAFPNQDIVDFIEECHEYDPEERPQSFDEVLSRLSEIAGEEYSDTVPKGAILRILQRGQAKKGEILTPARMILSKGREPVIIEFPASSQQPVAELQKYLTDGTPQGQCFEVRDRRHHDSVQQNGIIEVIEKGRIVDGKLEKKAAIILSLGPAPVESQNVGAQNFEPVSTAKQRTDSPMRAKGLPSIRVVSTAKQRTDSAPKIQIPSSFKFLREATHSCGGQSHTVQEYLHEPTGMEFVLVPGGSFEIKGKSVQLSPYLIGKHQVTQKVWKKIMDNNNPSNFKGDDLPVEKVSWHDCKKFCEKAGLFLPSEAQWEYACRAGTKTKYYWGDSDSEIGNYAWYDRNSDSKTHPVGQKKPNAFGLYDISGNVWEWCEDWYDSSNYPSSTNNPKGPSSGSLRVCRGGGFYGRADRCASGSRHYYDPGYRRDLGVRVIFSGFSD